MVQLVFSLIIKSKCLLGFQLSTHLKTRMILTVTYLSIKLLEYAIQILILFASFV